MGKSLLEQLKDADPNVANEYQAVMTNKTTMDVQGARRIFVKVMENRLISAGEAKSLRLIIDSGVLTPDARKALIATLLDTQSFAAMVNGSYQILKDGDKELEQFYKAFDKTANINFWSQKTVHQYTPAQYQVIKQQVKKGAIRIVKVLDSGLYSNIYGGNLAKYTTELNVMFVFFPKTGLNYFADLPLMVHELTHAVQDYFDFKGIFLKYVEADAYIAQAVASLIPGMTLKGTTAMEKAVLKAADFVQKKTATQKNQDWKDAYDDVVAQVEVHPEYAAKKNDEVDYYEDGKELQTMLDALKALEQNNKPAPASTP